MQEKIENGKKVDKNKIIPEKKIPEINGSSCSKLRGLIKKNLLILKRNKITTLCEILFPIILMLLMLEVRNSFIIDEYDFQTDHGTTTTYIKDRSVANINYNLNNSEITSDENNRSFYWNNLTILPALGICSKFNRGRKERPLIGSIGIPKEIKEKIILDASFYQDQIEMSLSLNNFKEFRDIKEMNDLHNLIKEIFGNLAINSKVLEVGAADGDNSLFIKSLGYNVTSSDVADDFLKTIKKNGLNLIKYNILTDSLNNKYNAIFCWRVFVHFTKSDSVKALKNGYDILENNGLFIFSVINKECKNIDNEWVDFPDIYHLGVDRYFNYYSRVEIADIINKTKFKILDIKDFTYANGIKLLVYILKK